MALIGKKKPQYVLLPIGGNLTMDAETAAFAVHNYFKDASKVIPM